MIRKQTSARAGFRARAVAWVLLFGLGGWLYAVSPKTPLDFFEAAIRDSERDLARRIEIARQIDSNFASFLVGQRDLKRLLQSKMRFELEREIATAPDRVREQRSDILLGFYSGSEETTQALLRDDVRYKEIAAEIEATKNRSKDPGQTARPIEHEKNERRHGVAAEPHEMKASPAYQAMVMKELSGFILREAAARIFWPE